MTDHVPRPTPFPEVNRLVGRLEERMRAILGGNLVGLYLDGSLARGGFDQASDIDFVAVTEGALSEEHFLALQAMHEQVAEGGDRLARDIEGYYVTPEALHGAATSDQCFPRLERGAGERLKWVTLGEDWIVHRYILREYGITLLGPPAREWIPPVPAAALRALAGQMLVEWDEYLQGEPTALAHSGAQSYAVLTFCRILCTLQTGDIVPKSEAARWAQATLDARWQPLIKQAVRERLGPYGAATPEAVAATRAFLEWALASVHVQETEDARRERGEP